MKRMSFLVLVSVMLLLGVGVLPAIALEDGKLDGAATAEFLGEAAGDAAGAAVAGAGDVNGDGYDDFVVGSFAGAAYLVLGGADGWSLGKNLGQFPIIRYTEEVAGDLAGTSVAGAGDVNGDGFDDIVVGARGNDDGGNQAGAAYLILGSSSPTGAGLGTAVQYTGDVTDSRAGWSVAGAGDVNADGYDDFLVGILHVSGNLPGAAYLVLGSAAPTGGSLGAEIVFTGEAVDDYAGISVAGAGDVTGDGYDDMLIGATGLNDGGAAAGAVYLIRGSTALASSNLSTALQYTGEAALDEAGTSVAGAGDVNGDGYDDFLVGAVGNNTFAGAAYLVPGSPAPQGGSLASAVKYTGEAANDGAGESVAGAGDVNGDGFHDFLVGARIRNALAGSAYLVLGSTSPGGGSLGGAIEFAGEQAGQQTGFVAGVGDADGDGYTDFLIGATRNGENGNGAGAAYLVLSDALTSGADPYRHRTRLAGAGDAVAVTLAQARVRVDFASNAQGGGDVAVTRHIIHPCDNGIRLPMPIWDVESDKVGPATTVDLRFEYTDGQLGDMVEANLKLYTRDSGKPCSAWTEVAGSVVDVDANAVSAAGLAGLSQFTIADGPPDPTMIGDLNLEVSASALDLWPASLAALMLIVGTGATMLRRRRSVRDDEVYELDD